MEEKEFDYINVIPFIDIMLVLLTIVLTTSTFVAQGTIPMELPKAAAVVEGKALKTLSIEIDRRGNLYCNSAPLSLADLAPSLGSFDRETPVSISADREIALQAFVEVMDVIKSEGFKRVSLRTEVRK